MTEGQPIPITQEDIERSRRVTGIGGETGVIVGSAADFDTLFDQFSTEQPELADYISGKYIAMALVSGGIKTNPSEPSLGPVRDPFLSGVLFTYFAVPESLRREHFDPEQAKPLERIFEESLTGGEDPAINLREVATRHFLSVSLFWDEVIRIGNGLTSGNARVEFVAGSLVILSPFISRQESSRLQRLWDFSSGEQK